MELCKLCKRLKQLRKSHIIPEFCYKPLYDAKHRVTKLDLDYNKNYLIQKGIREKILCPDCEELVNNEYEKPFHDFWFVKKPLPEKLPHEPYEISGINYKKFKLFHLSILFRAGVSTLNEFRQVSLGPHEENLRLMILNNKLEDKFYYTVGAVHINNKTTSKNHYLVISPCRTRFSEHNSYMFTFGGCAWNYMLSSHSQAQTHEIMLKEDGTLPLISVDWRVIVGQQKN